MRRAFFVVRAAPDFPESRSFGLLEGGPSGGPALLLLVPAKRENANQDIKDQGWTLAEIYRNLPSARYDHTWCRFGIVLHLGGITGYHLPL